MKIKFWPGIFVAALLIWGSRTVSLVMAQTPGGSELKLLSSDNQAIMLELTVADFEVETVDDAGRTYQRLVIPDMTQTDMPGEPQVPTRGTMVGLPSLSDVSVEILETDYDTLSGYYRLYPAPGLKVIGDNLFDGEAQETFALDQELYATNAFYPGQPVELGSTGMMRDQAVAQVQFYPVQYNPATGEVRFYRRILARLTWGIPLSSLTTIETRSASAAYEKVLRNTLLNYETLERPLVVEPGSSSGSSGAGIGDIGALDTTVKLKIGVTKDGMYKLTPSNLTDNGFSLSGVSLSTIKIKNQSTEIPIYAYDDNGNNAFDGNDYLLFYGTAITDIYTTKNIYWLEADGGPGQRMSLRDGTPGSGTVPAHFPTTLHAEEDTYYWQTMPNGMGQDHWFWQGRLSATGSRAYTVTLNNIFTTATTATVRVQLKGGTSLDDVNPDHQTKIYLNNNAAIDNQTWDGFAIYEHEVDVPHSSLIEGSNVITIETLKLDPREYKAEQVFINWIEIDYWDTYVAENNKLLFGAPEAGDLKFEVTNFDSNNVQVFDVTDPTEVKIITNAMVVADGAKYKLQFEDDDVQTNTRYLALISDAREEPDSIELDEPSDLKGANSAHYIIITHEDFYSSAENLATHRSTTGETAGKPVKVVNVENIYDEFNYGIFNPQAIRDFLSYAYLNWGGDPLYVLLLGDAYQDYKDNYNTDTINYVPSQIIETDLLGETPSDNWFVLVSGGDILPEMFIGRLSAQTIAQADDIVDKIIDYEQNPPGASWNKKMLLVADDVDDDFEDISEQIADMLPYYYTANKVYVSTYYSPNDPTTDITNQINNGSLLVNYAGHGAVDMWGQWSGGSIFNRSPHVTSLNNINKLPVVTIANCLNGFFPGPKTQISMAEEFQRRPDRGAVAVWAATGLGYAPGHRVLMGEFYNIIFQEDKYVLGQATTLAKIATYSQSSGWDELVETFVLFGDPATQLGGPGGPPQEPGDGSSVFLPLIIKN